MSYEDRKKQRYRRKKIREITVLLIIAYFILRAIPSFSGVSVKTILPQEETVSKDTRLEAVIIKNEEVYEIDGELSDEAKINEGSRVPVGYKINSPNLSAELNKKRNQIRLIDEAISIKSLSEEQKQQIINNNKNISHEKDAICEAIQENLDEFGKVKDLKKALKSTEEKIVNLNPNNEYLKHEVGYLTSIKNQVQEEINNNIISYSTTKSGLISYRIDGYEDKLKPINFEEYSYDALSSLDRNIEPRSGFRIIDNFYWYTALIVDDFEALDNPEDNTLLSMKINNSDTELTGKIMAVNKNDNKGVIIVRFNNYLEEFYNERFVISRIIKSKENAYKIPSRTIFEKDGINGVFIKEFSGIVKYRPVEILKIEGDFSYVSKGDNGYITLNKDENIRTIDLYDEILLNPSSVEEGQIIN